MRRFVKEEFHRHTKYVRNVLEAGSTNSIGTAFVLLYLLESYTNLTSQPFLAHTEHETPHADTPADVLIDRTWFSPHLKFPLGST